MDAMPRRRAKLWKILAVLIGSLAVVALAFWLWVESVASRRWGELEERVGRLMAEAKLRDPRRPVLRGEPVPGNAWEDYNRALEAASKIKDRFKMSGYLYRTGRPPRAEVVPIVSAHELLLDHLRAGARRAEGAYPYVWEDGWTSKSPRLSNMTALAELARCKARFLREDGRGFEAAELLLDLCQFGRDLGHNDYVNVGMLALSFVKPAVEDMKELVTGSLLSRDILTAVACGLATLDGSLPPRQDRRLNDCLLTGVTALQGDWKNLGVSPGWRHAFSRRIIAAAMTEHEERWARMDGAAERASWLRAREAYAALAREPELAISYFSGPSGAKLFLSEDRSRRITRVYIRLLRAAAALRLEGRVPALEDPFGDTLRHAEVDGKVRIWSVGQDGVDGGGKGDWDSVVVGPDIVLEVAP